MVAAINSCTSQLCFLRLLSQCCPSLVQQTRLVLPLITREKTHTKKSSGVSILMLKYPLKHCLQDPVQKPHEALNQMLPDVTCVIRISASLREDVRP